MLLRKGKFCLVLSVLFLVQSTAWAESDANDSAGQVKFAKGNVKIISSGSEQAAHQGSLVKEGDTIVTDITGSAQLDMKDEGTITVRPDSRLQIATYKMNPDGNTGRAIFKLLKGSFRSITGLIGKKTPENYEVQTPTATIGIRGTDHETMFVPPGGWSVAPPLQEEGTFDTVYSGKTVLSNQAGQIEITANKTGHVNSYPNRAPYYTSMPEMMRLIPYQMLIDKFNLSNITPAQLIDTLYTSSGLSDPENFKFLALLIWYSFSFQAKEEHDEPVSAVSVCRLREGWNCQRSATFSL